MGEISSQEKAGVKFAAQLSAGLSSENSSKLIMLNEGEGVCKLHHSLGGMCGTNTDFHLDEIKHDFTGN